MMRHTSMAALVASLAMIAPAWSQSVRAGSEFQVNTYTPDIQDLPALAMDLAGNFVVVWESYGQDGSSYGVFGQLFDSSGALRGTEFQVNTYTTYLQRRPAVAMDASGDFVVVWDSLQDGDGAGVFGQRFNSAGVKQGLEFQVNTFTSFVQYLPGVAMDAVGNFVVVWKSSGEDGDGNGIFAQRFNNAGAKLGVEFQVNTYTTFDQGNPKVASDPAGNFTVVWESSGQDGGGYGVFAQRFSNTGSRRGTEFRVNTSTAYDQKDPAIAVSAPGDFVVVWSGQGGAAGDGLFGRRFNSAGVAKGAEFEIEAFTTTYPGSPKVAADASGSFAVVWQDRGKDGSSAGVAGQQFNNAGLKRGPEFLANTFTSFDQKTPTVATDPKGNFTVAWQSNDQDGSLTGVFGQRYVCTDADADGLCDLQDLIVTSPAEMAVLDCNNPLTGRPTIQWDAGEFDRFRVFIGTDPNFAVGTKVSSGDTLLRKITYLVPTKKWRIACRKAITADPQNPTLFIEVFGVNVNVPKSASNRKTFSQVVKVFVQP